MAWWRRGLVVLALVGSGLGTGNAAVAAGFPVASNSPTSAGTVTLTRTVDPAAEEADFAVTFQGRISDHGWTYRGALSGSGTTWDYIGGIAEPPYLTMSSADGSIGGWCAGSSDTADTVDSTTLDMEFRCVLARNGGTPWQVVLDAAQSAGTVTSQGSWSGQYVGVDTGIPKPATPESLTYGAVQLGSHPSEGAISYGPLRLSGEIALGSTLYRGDLVSDTSAFVASADIPPLSMSGTSNGVTVTGTCSGSPDQTVSNAVPAYDITCSLTADNAAAVTVTVLAVLPDGAYACSFRDCLSDQTGWFNGSAPTSGGVG